MHRASKITNHSTHKGGYCFTMLMALGMILFSHTTSLLAVEIDHGKMRRDLDIAEEALKYILQYRDDKQMETGWLDTDQIESTYIDNYGVVFIVKSSATAPQKIKERGDPSTPPHKSAIPFLPHQKEARISEFLKTYGPTITQLKNSDQITVIIDTQQHIFRIANLSSNTSGNTKHSTIPHQLSAGKDTTNFVFFDIDKTDVFTFKPDSTSKSHNAKGVRVRIVKPDSVANIDSFHVKIMNPNFMANVNRTNMRSITQASIHKRNLKDLQDNDIADKNLRETLNIQTFSADTTFIKKVDILSGIFDTMLGFDSQGILNDNKTTGTYIPNLGAIFFINQKPSNTLHWTEKDSPNDPTKIKEILIATLADYGATLHDVKPNEDILIHFQAAYPLHHVPHTVLQAYFSQEATFKGPIHKQVDYTKTTNNESPQSLTLRVKKKHLIDYAMGKIDMKKLRDKIMITEY